MLHPRCCVANNFNRVWICDCVVVLVLAVDDTGRNGVRWSRQRRCNYSDVGARSRPGANCEWQSADICCRVDKNMRVLACKD